MKSVTIRSLVAALLLFASPFAQATITCTAPTSGGISTAYLSTGLLPNYTQGSFSTTCTRSSGADALTVLIRANNGANATGTQNRARLGTSFILYELYQNSGCTGLWSNIAPPSSTMITLNLANVTTAQTISTPSYWGCITTAQSVAAGTYTDTVTMRVVANTGAGNLSPNGTFAVSINNVATCSITSVANVGFGTYIAFRNTSLVSPPANVVMNCTTNLPYFLSLDATSGVIPGVGLNYSLATSWVAGSQLRGTGPGQTHTIIGTLPANQAGTCNAGSCTCVVGVDCSTRTLTVTY